MRAVEMARWPAALEPWLDPALRARVLPPPWTAACSTGVGGSGNGLRIVGLSNGETIRRAGDGPPATLRLEARGGEEELIWLLNGRQVGRVPARQAFMLSFAEPGSFQITVLDRAGQHDRVEISVR
jgi:penicillin-binding protein 1C